MRKKIKQFGLIIFLNVLFFFFTYMAHAESLLAEKIPKDSIQIENITDVGQQALQDEGINTEKPIEEDQSIYNDTVPEIKEEREAKAEVIMEEKENKKIDKNDVLSEHSISSEKLIGEDSFNPTSEKSKETQIIHERVQAQQTPGLIDVQLLTDRNLNAEYQFDGKHTIKLTYQGYGVLDLGLLNNTYAIFNLPTEIMQLINLETTTISASYDVPALGIIIPILRNRGKFSEDAIQVDGNQIYMNFLNLLSLNLLSNTHYEFTLTIKLEDLPPSRTGEYNFYAESTTQLVDVSILSGSPASAILAAPPEAPTVNEPIYNNHTVVEGTSLVGTIVELTIGDRIINGIVDENGYFQITIEAQPPGTEITAVLINEEGMRSPPNSVIVQEATISFYQVPETIIFEPTKLNTGLQQIPIYSTDSLLSVIDTRGQGSLVDITAQAEPLFNKDYEHALPYALVYINERGEKYNLSEESLVYSGVTGREQISEIIWNENQGPFVEVDPSNAYEGTYETTITWTLIDGP